MNATEHIVESYFRLCRGCFTQTDRKVDSGNNRQFDLLAYDLKKDEQFHIEISVTHALTWCLTRENVGVEFEKKFFGAPAKRTSTSGAATDYEKGRSYFPQIESAYQKIGFKPEKVKRVWVCWILKGKEENSRPISFPFRSKHLNRVFDVEVLSLRDYILPELEKTIRLSNYEDEVLRTLSLLKQRALQVKGKT